MSTSKPLPSQVELMALFHYDSGSGVLSWRPRTLNNARLNGRWATQFAGKPAGHVMEQGYLGVRIDGVFYLVHRVIWKMVMGEEPRFVDHKDLVKSNNRWGNLRECSKTENQGNSARRPANKCGHKNIHWDNRDGVWVVTIQKSGGRHARRCRTLAGAIAWQRLKSAELYGQFARSA